MDNRGQTTVEYILVAVLVILALIFAFKRAAIWESISVAASDIQESLIVEE